MKPTKLFLSLVCFALLLNACKTGEEVIGSKKNNEYVNAWMMDNLSKYYYWNDKLPSRTDKSLDPEVYFNSVLYWYDPVTAPDGDRFSWIDDDYENLIGSLSGVNSNEIGFDLALYYKDRFEFDVIGQINYVKKGTPAEASGLKRGMFFDRINGMVLTKNNYQSLLNVKTADFAIGFVNPVINAEGDVTGFTSTYEKTVQTVAEYAENPVYMDTIFSINGHKIGYFVYHFFAPYGKTKDYAYDLAMNNVFGRFKTAGITDLILDLRYNSGGHTTSSQLLASEIVPNVSNAKLYTYYRCNPEYNAAIINENGADYLKTYFTTNVLNGNTVIGTVNNIGDQLGGKVYVLTGNHTASASEQVINGLKPYMDVVLVGDTTYGKNVASTTIYDIDHTSKNRWAIQPIIAKYFNSLDKSDFTAGFYPDFVVSEGGINMKEFGDIDEPLLNTAINDIVEIQLPTLVQKRAETMRVERFLSLPGKRIRGLQLDKLPFFE